MRCIITLLGIFLIMDKQKKSIPLELYISKDAMPRMQTCMIKGWQISFTPKLLFLTESSKKYAPASRHFFQKGHDSRSVWGSLQHPGTCQEGMSHPELDSMVYNCSSPANTVEPLIPKLLSKLLFFLTENSWMLSSS